MEHLTVILVLALSYGASGKFPRSSSDASDIMQTPLSDILEDDNTTNTVDRFGEIRFFLIWSNGRISFGIDNAATLISDVQFVRSRPTAFYIHGYTDDKDSLSSATVSSALIRNGSFNVIIVDWSAYSGFPYLSALSNLPGASRAIGSALNRMVLAGLDAESVWLIGHSLGAQLIGIASQSINFRIQRIAGLDPAGPGFEAPDAARLTRNAGELVEVIHSDAGVFGFDQPCGHIDFWPNGGTAVQPGCGLQIACSHARSFFYFAESVVNTDAFPAVMCSSWIDFRRGACPVNETNVAYLGQNTAGGHKTGNFYLITNRASPFGKGLLGIKIP